MYASLVQRNQENRTGIGATESKVPIPEAWLGRAVDLVFASGSSTEYAAGGIVEVNDRGIVLSVQTHRGHPARLLFYPWSAVIQLTLSESPDE